MELVGTYMAMVREPESLAQQVVLATSSHLVMVLLGATWFLGGRANILLVAVDHS